jgi:hypothetical protein
MIQAEANGIHIEHNKLIGKIGDEYYYLRYIFDRGGGLSGAAGCSFSPVSTDEAQERRDSYDDDNKLWKQAVEGDYTTLGADDWHEMNPAEDEMLFDLSYRDLANNLMVGILAEECQRGGRDLDIELIECTGGGRCFNANMQWDKLYNRNLWEIIKQYES